MICLISMVQKPPDHTDSQFLRRVHARSETLVEGTTNQLWDLIKSGHFGPGERLPSERVLLKGFEVSRTVLREALSSLEALGIVEGRSTRGRFVCDPASPSTRSQTLVGAWLYQHALAISELDEIRSLVEPFAIRQIPPASISTAVRLGSRLLAEQADAIERADAVAAASLDDEFHTMLVSFLPNQTLRILAQGLIERSRDVSLAVYSLPEGAKTSLRQHRRILKALEGGDLERAADLVFDHSLNSGESSRGGLPLLDQTTARVRRRAQLVANRSPGWSCERGHHQRQVARAALRGHHTIGLTDVLCCDLAKSGTLIAWPYAPNAGSVSSS